MMEKLLFYIDSGFAFTGEKLAENVKKQLGNRSLTTEESRFYLEKGKENAIETAKEILESLRNQKSKEEILNQFKAKYYDDNVKSIYPIDAMELNTNIMINLIEKELFKNEFFDKR